ncbi:hypothetical protein P4C99_09530 [Pontiellaceae bacterium B1224]|nr:hypothetical protein [Pontiellaceae bacterium B1224]
METVNADFSQLVRLHRTYSSSVADFGAATKKLKRNLHESMMPVLNARDVMHAQMTEEEWTAVFKDENEK